MTKLRFVDSIMAGKFAALIKRHGFAADQYVQDGWSVVQSAIDGVPKRKMMREWCLISLEDNTKPNNNQKADEKLLL